MSTIGTNRTFSRELSRFPLKVMTETVMAILDTARIVGVKVVLSESFRAEAEPVRKAS